MLDNPTMMYVLEQGAVLRRRGQTVVVEKGGQALATAPVFRLQGIVVFGNITLTTQVMALALEEGVDVSFQSLAGRYRGRLAGPASPNIYLRAAQHHRAADSSFSMSTARVLVATKLANCITMVRRYQRNHPEIQLTAGIDELVRIKRRAVGANNIDQLRGLEGAGTAAYFRCYRRMLRAMTFERRVRRPPRDPVNAMLSLGYALLTGETTASATARGLEPHVGFLHGLGYGRPSLALDMIEPFRQPVVDSMVMDLVNRGRVASTDFEQHDADSDDGVRLSKSALEVFIASYERWMTRPFKDAQTGRDTSLRLQLRLQIDSCAQAISRGTELRAFRVQT